MIETCALRSLSLPALRWLAERLALFVRGGDMIALRGDLGAGKTTFARFLIGALRGDEGGDIVSPTFSLVQDYDSARAPIVHFDLYRLRDPAELDEIGFGQLPDQALTLVEWPERAEAQLPPDRLDIRFEDGPAADLRHVTLTGTGDWAARLHRLGQMQAFLDAAGWGEARATYLQGDASQRAYVRLTADALASAGPHTAVLMNAPRQPDGPPVRDGLPYSRVAHLAEDVRPFVAIARTLRATGLSVPDVLSADLDRGLLLLEDLSDLTFGALMAKPRSGLQEELWTAALDALVALRRAPPPLDCGAPGDARHTLPRLSRTILEIESELMVAWCWPELKGAPAPAEVRAENAALWAPLIARLVAEPPGWLLRDYHSPNLLWLPERAGVARVGIIDFQDALQGPWAHDVMSLLQDARVDVPAALEDKLLERYCRGVAAFDPAFDRDGFLTAYRIYGAERATRLLGLWFRLLRRDGKPQYLQHAPRTWDYLARNLAHPALAPLKQWYDRHFPPALRGKVGGR